MLFYLGSYEIPHSIIAFVLDIIQGGWLTGLHLPLVVVLAALSLLSSESVCVSRQAAPAHGARRRCRASTVEHLDRLDSSAVEIASLARALSGGLPIGWGGILRGSMQRVTELGSRMIPLMIRMG